MPVEIDEAGLTRLFPDLDGFQDAGLRNGVVAIWLEVAAECLWTNFEDVPKNLGTEKGHKLTDHIRGVTRMALALADSAAREQGVSCNRDHLLAACLLHDVSKPLETMPDPDAPPGGSPGPAVKSPLGRSIQHAVYATHKIFAHRLPLEVAHLVVTHTHESNVRSTSLEAAFLFYADYADSDAAIAAVGGRTYASRWKME